MFASLTTHTQTHARTYTQIFHALHKATLYRHLAIAAMWQYVCAYASVRLVKNTVITGIHAYAQLFKPVNLTAERSLANIIEAMLCVCVRDLCAPPHIAKHLAESHTQTLIGGALSTKKIVGFLVTKQ